MNKWSLLFLFPFSYTCTFLPEVSNIWNPKTSDWFLSAMLLESEFQCNLENGVTRFGSLSEFVFRCNRELLSETAVDIESENLPYFANLRINFLNQTDILFQFDPISIEGSLPISLEGLRTNSGERLRTFRWVAIVDNQLPSLDITDYLGKKDYTFFSPRYWDFTFTEPVEIRGLPQLRGSVASSIVIRTAEKISSNKVRVSFETLGLENKPGNLTFLFNSIVDSNGNSVNNTLTITLVGFLPGPNLVQGRYDFDAHINQNGDIIALYGSNSSAEIWRNGTEGFILTNPNLPTIVTGEKSMLTSGSEILVTGGIEVFPTVVGSKAYLFQSDTATWETLPNEMLFRRAYHNMVKISPNKILVLGGLESYISGGTFVSLNRAEIYDTEQRSFRLLPNLMTTPRTFACSVLLDDGRVFIIGGTDGIFAPKDTTEFFDPITESFSPGPSLPVPVAALRCQKLSDGNVLIYGAQISNLNNSTMLYQPALNQVFTLATSNIRREWAIAAELPDGGLLFHGGGYRNSTYTPSRNLEKLDYGKSNSFFRMGSIDYDVFKHSMVKRMDGSFFFLGGGTTASPTKKTSIYGNP